MFHIDGQMYMYVKSFYRIILDRYHVDYLRSAYEIVFSG